MRLTFEGRDYELPPGTRVSIQFPAELRGAGASLELTPTPARTTPVRPAPERPARIAKPGAGPGRGRKLCPKCNEIVGNHTTVCMCGHRW